MINNIYKKQEEVNKHNTLIIEMMYNALRIVENESRKKEVYKILENANKEETITLFDEFKRKSGKELIIPYIIENKVEFFLVPYKNNKHYRKDFVAFAIINDKYNEANIVFKTLSEFEKESLRNSWKSNHKVSEKLRNMEVDVLNSKIEINTFEDLLYYVLLPHITSKKTYNETKINEIISNLPSAEIIKTFKYSIDIEKKWSQKLSNQNFNIIKSILNLRLNDLINARSEKDMISEIIYYSVRFNFKKGMIVSINKSQDLFRDFENIERSNIKIKNKINFYNIFFDKYRKNKEFNEYINKLNNNEKCLILEIACILNEKNIINALSKNIMIDENFNVNVYKKYYAYSEAEKNKVASDREIKENLKIIKLNKVLRR
ncbi:MAG: hypothetical protein ACP5RI_02305 [Candidatus Micrarchaeia archaeon]